MPKTKVKPSQILINTREKRGLTKTDFSRIVGISRPTQDKWEQGGKMDLATLQDIALRRVGTWVGDFAVALIRARFGETSIPCICLLQIGDNGICPKHQQTKEMETHECST